MNRIIRDTTDFKFKMSVNMNDILFRDLVATYGVDYAKLTEEEIRQKADSLNWDLISQASPVFEFSDNFFHDYSSELDWDDIINRRLHDEKFIYKFYDKFNWKNPNLKDGSYSEDLLDFLIERVDFPLQNNLFFSRPSEKFIRKHIQKIDRITEAAIQCNVGDEFLEEYKEQIEWKKFIKEVKSVSEETLERFKEYIDWHEFTQNFTAAPDIIEKYESYILKAFKKNQVERFDKKIKKIRKDEL